MLAVNRRPGDAKRRRQGLGRLSHAVGHDCAPLSFPQIANSPSHPAAGPGTW
jgi:hypothetical protein